MPRVNVPVQYSRFVLLASVCVVIAGLYFAREVMVPLALAILLSFLLAPVATRLERWGLGRVPSVLIVTILSFAVLAVIGYLVYSQLADLAEQLPAYRGNIESKVRAVQSRFGHNKLIGMFNGGEAILPQTAPATPPEKIQVVRVAETQISALATMSSRLMTILAPLGTAAIVIVFTIFILFQRQDLRDRLLRLTGGRLITTTQALDDAAQRVSRFLVAQAIVNGTYGLAIAIGLASIGYFLGDQLFPNFILWGLLCALVRFIPYLGPWIGAAPPLVLALAVFPGAQVFLATVGLFVVIELISNNLMEPWLYGTSTGISSIAVLVAAVFWTSLWGIPGLFLSTPLTVCLVVLGKYVPQLQFLDILLGDAPVLSPAERFYQRLLAMDADEAGDLVDEELKSGSLEDVYHRIIIPALELAEQDRHRGNLDEEHQKFIRQALHELIEDLGERHALPRTMMSASAETKPAADPTGSGPPHVLCLPAHDQGDELAAMMFSQVLAKAGYRSEAVSFNSLASEMIQKVDAERPDAVCISALPPSAVVHSRYLCKRLTARFPQIKMLAGLWASQVDPKRAQERLGLDEKNVWVATSFHGAVEQLRQITHPPLAPIPTPAAAA